MVPVVNTFEIYKATPRAVVPISASFSLAECVGVGITQAKALIDRFHEPYLSREETELFAIYVMRLVKNYVPDVDGFTQLVSADHFGRVKWWPSSKVLAIEQKLSEFEKREKGILARMCSRPGERDWQDPLKGENLETIGRDLSKLREELWEIAGPIEADFQAKNDANTVACPPDRD